MRHWVFSIRRAAGNIGRALEWDVFGMRNVNGSDGMRKMIVTIKTDEMVELGG